MMRLVVPADAPSLFLTGGSAAAAEPGAGMTDVAAPPRETAEAGEGTAAGEDAVAGEGAVAGEDAAAGEGAVAGEDSADGEGAAATFGPGPAKTPEIIAPRPVSNQLASRSG